MKLYSISPVSEPVYVMVLAPWESESPTNLVIRGELTCCTVFPSPAAPLQPQP